MKKNLLKRSNILLAGSTLAANATIAVTFGTIRASAAGSGEVAPSAAQQKQAEASGE